MRSASHLTIPQPCHESWAAMTPAAQGRHCAACAKTVIDFTELSDAEILEHLAGAGRSGTCGRFRAGQLGRPLQPVALAPARGWRAWLATLATVWGLREGATATAAAQVPVEQHRPETQGPENLQARRRDDYEGVRVASPVVLRGVVVDENQQPAPYVTVLVKNTKIGVATDTAGRFELPVPAANVADGQVPLMVHSIGYEAQEHMVSATTGQLLRFALQPDTRMLGGLVVMEVAKVPPAPWHPRRFYYWSKYWLTRPFRSQ